jgi:hypothetical protein
MLMKSDSDHHRDAEDAEGERKNQSASLTGYQKHGDEMFPKGIATDGASFGLAWIPDKNIRE